MCLIATIPVLLFFVLLCACGGAEQEKNVVHMNETDFLLHSITIQKGETITLVDDVPTVHIIENGTWKGRGGDVRFQEKGAPKVDLQISGTGQSHKIGPFAVAGTFQFYCTVHLHMNLTVIVK